MGEESRLPGQGASFGTDELVVAITERRSAHVLDGLYLHVFSDSVINIDGRARDLERADVELVRLAISDAGYTEVESWLPMVGVSWLSGGLSAGVSFRIARKEAF